MGDPEQELTTLIARPRAWQRAQRWPGALLLAVGLWSFVFGLEPAALAFVAIGFWGTAEFWRGIRVTGDRLVAQGRLVRKTVPLAEILDLGTSRSRTVWVQSKGRRTLVLHMAETRLDRDGAGSVLDIEARLRDLSRDAGASLDPAAGDLRPPPRPATPFFGW